MDANYPGGPAFPFGHLNGDATGLGISAFHMSSDDLRCALELTPHFYRAALDFSAFPEVLRQLNGVFGAAIGQVTLANFHTQDLIATANFGMTEKMLNAWLALPHHIQLDPRVAYALRMRNRPFCEREVLSLEAWHGSRFYDLLMRPFGLDSTLGALTDIDEERGILAGLKFIRRSRDAPFNREDVERLHLYLPHFREAMRCAARVRDAEDRANVFSEIFDQLKVATVVTDRFAQVRYANQAAQCLLSPGDGLLLSRDTVIAADHSANAALHGTILKTLAEGSNGGTSRSFVRIPRCEHASDFLVSVAPAGGMGLHGVAHQMLAVVFVLDPERRYEGDAEALQRMFGLTETESEIMLRIARGVGPRDSAKELGRSYETVRSHLKVIYDKTGARSQAALTALAFAATHP